MDDVQAMERCIELAAEAAQRGDHPFGALILRDGELVAEGPNLVITDLDPTAHGEVIAIRRACQTLGRQELADCTLFTSAEPCWICSTAIRVTGIARVVFAARSGTDTGGYSSRFRILSDAGIARFGPPPEVVAGFLAERAEALWEEINWTRRPPPSKDA
jgi:tRNA(adenine34) deaminase